MRPRVGGCWELRRCEGGVVVWKSDAALRVVVIVGGVTYGGASLTIGYACIVAFRAPIRPRYAGLCNVCSGGSHTLGRFAYHRLCVYRRLSGADTTALRGSHHRA